MAVIWRINPIAYLYWRQWEEGCILFNASAAQTHLLNELATTVLKLLQQAPCSIIDLSEHLATYFDIDWDHAAGQTYLQSVLNELDELGLIEPYIP